MAEVRVPVRGADLSADHAVTAVLVFDDVGWLQWCGEARPSTRAVELIGGGKEWLARHDVHVEASLLVVPELVVESRLGRRLLRDVVLTWRETFYGLGFLLVYLCPSYLLLRGLNS